MGNQPSVQKLDALGKTTVRRRRCERDDRTLTSKTCSTASKTPLIETNHGVSNEYSATRGTMANIMSSFIKLWCYGTTKRREQSKKGPARQTIKPTDTHQVNCTTSDRFVGVLSKVAPGFGAVQDSDDGRILGQRELLDPLHDSGLVEHLRRNDLPIKNDQIQH
jgi:hypothetical protein